MTTPLTPLAGRIVVKRLEPKRVTDKGLAIPKEFQIQESKGVVVELGPDISDINIGDNIVYGRYSGTEIEVDGEKYLIMRKDDVIAVL